MSEEEFAWVRLAGALEAGSYLIQKYEYKLNEKQKKALLNMLKESIKDVK